MAAWGGYTFVINMIGVHAFVMAVLLWNGDCSGLHHAYSLMYILGTLGKPLSLPTHQYRNMDLFKGAIQLPVVGLAPLKNLELLMPLGVFVLIQLEYVSLFAMFTPLTNP